MTEKKGNIIKRFSYSLRGKMMITFFAGAILASVVYVILRFSIITYVNNTYNAPDAKAKRQENYISSLQRYADANNITSDDTASFAKWVKENRYVYLLIYKDDELFFSDGSYNSSQGPVTPPFVTEGGGIVGYPDKEQLIEEAEKSGLYALELEDGTLFASLADFSEYLYYNIANITSLIGAFVVLAMVIFAYIRDITNRITGLRADVSIVSAGNMNHTIKSSGDDELANLCENVENMRSAMLVNISREKEAMEANSQLITSMSHDIRTPLTVLLGYLDIMKMHNCDEDMEGYIKASESTALRLKELSDDMFKYFLAFGGESEITLTLYDAKTLIQQLFSEHVLLLTELGYTVELDDSVIKEGMTVKTDAPLLMRLVDNVFSNINKYADKEYPINIKFEETDAAVSVSVKNRINKDADRTESSRIGLKTCERISSALGLNFSYTKEESEFTVMALVPKGSI